MNTPEQAAPPSEEFPYWLRALLGTPLAALGGLVTVGFGFALCGYIASRVGGGRPAPDMIHFLMLWLVFGAAPCGAGILLLRRSPTSKGFWRWIFLSLLILFLASGIDGNFGPRNWHQLFRGEKLPETNAASLKQTIVSPHLEAKIVRGQNVLWCGTFQMVWNEACRLTGSDLQFKSEQPMVSVLNKHSFTKESLDESSYIAMAGLVGDNIHERIRKAIDEKFRGEFKPRFIPKKGLTPRPQDIVAYSCLYKNLSFITPFERLDEALTFGGVRVSAFGIGRHKASLEKMYPQVLILDYQGEDDFVIELKTKSDGDRLILAKLQPAANLEDTVMGVGSRIARSQTETASTNDLLIVPRMKIDFTREYSEIEGLALSPKGTNVAKDLLLASAVQSTAFEMSEKGVELRSEAHMAFGCAKAAEPVSKHKMIFNKPFLILMQRRDARVPYFAFWVDNPEVLIAWK